ncbi:uncharacterized protein B0I36DRAFT_366216 [Microdochium trichocladiopsis]|uniref:Rhodopsin domain-containing protein n=1 Tax=Microdochium trichocladiopsis TaxID=1682393 RepID=A0A9P8Y362_9PEZI|nr:uncharacterized protein B0I36DRAFT_366216 [Microdochium trichocladiopsis]KAH7026684.1 hypothetical protein B0I36DRAFT_366216 [Microdochium trichocladiopsis]
MSASLGWVSNPVETREPLLESVFWPLVVVSSFPLGLRLWIRWTHNRWQADDYCLILAWICLLAFVVVTQFAISLGFGKHALDVPFKSLNTLAIIGAAGLTISILGMLAAKISFAVTLLHLTKDLWKWANWLIWFMISTLIITAIPAAVLPWVQCTPLAKTFVDFLQGKCINKAHSVRFAMFQALYSASADFLFALLPWKILWGLQMRPVEKFGVDDGPLAVTWADVELSTTIIVACIPVLRKMIRDEVSTRTRSGNTTGGSRVAAGTNRASFHGGTGLASSSRRNSFHMSRLGNKADATGVGTKGNNNLTKWYTVYERDDDQQSDRSIILRSSKMAVAVEKGPREKQDHGLSWRDSLGDDRSEPTTPDALYLQGQPLR